MARQRIVVCHDGVAVTAYPEDGWATLAVWYFHWQRWLVCRTADVRVRLDQPGGHPHTRATVADLRRRVCQDVLPAWPVHEAIQQAQHRAWQDGGAAA